MLSIDQLLPIWVFYAKESEAPIAVVDDAGRTIGLVDARAVLAALAGTPSDDRAAAPLADRAGLLEGSRG